jgi:hypothetical protein
MDRPERSNAETRPLLLAEARIPTKEPTPSYFESRIGADGYLVDGYSPLLTDLSQRTNSMRSQDDRIRRRAAARRTRRDASVSVQRLEGRALLAQTFGFPGLGPVANLPLSMLNPQPLVLNLTPTLTNAPVPRTNTSVAITITRPTITITTPTGTSSLVAPRVLPTTITREFVLRPGPIPSVPSASEMPTSPRLTLAPTGPATVVVLTNPAPTPPPAPGPAGPVASHGHHVPRHHQQHGPRGLQGHHGH